MTTWEKWHKDPVSLATVVIAAATLVNLIISLLIWSSTYHASQIAEASFKAGNRAYIGLDTISINRDDSKHLLQFDFVMKNFGNVPTKGILRWKAYINGNPQPGLNEPNPEETIFPGNHGHFIAGISGPMFDAVVSHTARLEVHLYASYKGIQGENYEYCEKHYYDPSGNGFSSNGTCSGDEFKKTQ